MTTVELKVTLPDDVAQRARSAGLLTSEAVGLLLEEALRRDAGQRLLKTMARLQSENVEPMTMEEIQAEVDAVRAARRARRG